MNIVSAMVLYLVIWFMCLFIALPLRLKSQSEDGHVVPGTPASAPVDPKLKIKVKWVTAAALVIWALVVAVILSGVISIQDLDYFHRM